MGPGRRPRPSPGAGRGRNAQWPEVGDEPHFVVVHHAARPRTRYGIISAIRRDVATVGGLLWKPAEPSTLHHYRNFAAIAIASHRAPTPLASTGHGHGLRCVVDALPVSRPVRRTSGHAKTEVIDHLGVFGPIRKVATPCRADRPRPPGPCTCSTSTGDHAEADVRSERGRRWQCKVVVQVRCYWPSRVSTAVFITVP